MTIWIGDCRTQLAALPPASIDCVVTSPPYWQQRDYAHADQLGQEATPEAYVDALVGVFAVMQRTLKPSATVWLNLGDGYASRGSGPQGKTGAMAKRAVAQARPVRRNTTSASLPAKQLIGMPWRVALALQAAGWYLRSAIVWHKTNPMPESVRTRPTQAHEFIFLLTQAPTYYYHPGEASNVWTLPTQRYRGAHFACMPLGLVQRCLALGCPPDGHVLDPFLGAGTTALAAQQTGRPWTGIELNAEFAALAATRLAKVSRES